MASYRVEVDRQLRKVIRKLPGNFRQRVIRTLEDLEDQPRPDNSLALDTSKAQIKLATNTEFRRIRIETWRVIYLLEEAERLVTVLAIRKRPPYQYEDLPELLERGLG